MKNFLDSYIISNKPFIILSAVCVAFLAAGFLFPPPGEIHNSVLIGVGEIIAIMSLWTVVIAIGRGADAKFTKGDVTVEINNPDSKEANNDTQGHYR